MESKLHFFIKLIPPRPTFAQDMDEKERKLMMEHIVYWKELQEKRIAIVYGPVTDPNGSYGMGVVEVENESVVKEIISKDPTLISGLNKIEYYPMRAFFLRK